MEGILNVIVPSVKSEERKRVLEKQAYKDKLVCDIREIVNRIKACENAFNEISDDDFQDAMIYELKSLTARYEYLLKIAKSYNVKIND